MAPAETPTQPPVEERNRSELATSQAELHRLAPDVDDGIIERLVETAHGELMPAKVHSYVPILIVHQVRGILRGRPTAA